MFICVLARCHCEGVANQGQREQKLRGMLVQNPHQPAKHVQLLMTSNRTEQQEKEKEEEKEEKKEEEEEEEEGVG